MGEVKRGKWSQKRGGGREQTREEERDEREGERVNEKGGQET